MSKNPNLIEQLSANLKDFQFNDLNTSAYTIFATLGYDFLRKTNISLQTFLENAPDFDPESLQYPLWEENFLLGQLTDEDLNGQVKGSDKPIDNSIIHSYLFAAITLTPQEHDYSRSRLAQITRAVNKYSAQPILILFKHKKSLTLAMIHRRLNKHDDSKDVLEKVTLLKDIRYEKPHRAHLEILAGFAFENLNQPQTFVELHHAWQQKLSNKILNKQFYKELSEWYSWAKEIVVFPCGNFQTNSKPEDNARHLIRLLTRLLFVWFIKERGLIPEELFDRKWLANHLIDFDENPIPNDSLGHNNYYRAILQNLFFATLNQKEKRAFRTEGNQRNITTLMRYKHCFKNDDKSEKFLDLVQKTVPFINGGLFDCLDKPIDGQIGPKGGDVIAYEDGFSDHKANNLSVPDSIFFSDAHPVDLNKAFGTTNKKYIVRGLIDILNDYKFTVAENTPIEEDIALDPELLGQVFENLLSSYNENAAQSVRKQTGSFYTPREIVDHMVNESLLTYFQNIPILSNETDRLRMLLDYEQANNPFETEPDKINALIHAIDNCQILDPACGSGAFPMGMLHKLVFLLSKLDPDNKEWKNCQLKRFTDEPSQQDIHDIFTENNADYGRKLYLIENCIYGVDIQSIAIQISKLRFFISLIVDQKIDFSKDNFSIRPLPNLETKFIAANTLISIQSQKNSQHVLCTEQMKSLQQALKRIRHEIFSTKSPSKKRTLRAQDKACRSAIKEEFLLDGWNNADAEKLAQWDPYNQNNYADFFDSNWMFGIENGFDIVIGNPPYLRVQGLSKEQKQEYAKRFKSATGAYDLYILFTEKGFELLNPKGVLNFIQPDKWVNGNLGKGLRNLTANHIQKLISFKHYKVFNASTYSSLLWITKAKQQQMLYAELDRDLPDNEDLNNWLQNLEKDDFSTNDNKNLSENAWVFTKPEASYILNKLTKHPRKITDIFERIFTGLQTSKDEVYFLENCQQENEFIIGYSKALNKEVQIEKEFVKPLLKGDNVHRWESLKLENYVIFPYHIELKEYQNEVLLMPEKFISDNFKLGLKYLKNNENVLRGREKGNFDNEQWYQFSRNQGIKFEGIPKLICPYISIKSQFSFDEAGIFYTNTKVFGFIKYPHITESEKYFLAVLNSNLLWFYITNVSAVFSGGYYAYTLTYLENFPIPQIPEADQKPFIKLVDYILFIKKQAGRTETAAMCQFFEKLIDALVYELYFPEELHAANKYFMLLILQENLPDLAALPEDKMKALEQLISRLSDKNHPLCQHLETLGQVPVVSIIEGHSALMQKQTKK